MKSTPTLPPGYADPVLLGSGRWGTTWRARQDALGRDVVLKITRTPGLTASGRMDEAKRQAGIASHVLPAVLDAFPWHGQVCIVMEWLQGVTVERLLQSGSLNESATWHLTLTMVRHVETLHRAGLAHGDLKPSNLMVLQDGSLRLLDLGLAQETSDGKAMQGTPAYLPPESFRGQSTPTGRDLWAMGVLVAECLLGRRPDLSKGPGELLNGLSALPEVHPLWIPLLLSALETDPSRRWSSPAEWLEQMSLLGPFPNGQEELSRLCRPVFEHEMSQACLAAGHEQLRKRDPGSAFRLVSEALEWDPDHWPAMELLGKIDLGTPPKRRWPRILAGTLVLIAATGGFLAGRNAPEASAPKPLHLKEPAAERLAVPHGDSLGLGPGPGFAEGAAVTLPARLALSGIPAGCTLFVDGTALMPRSAGLFELPSGTHHLQVSRAGAVLWQTRVKALAYQHLSLHTGKGTP